MIGKDIRLAEEILSVLPKGSWTRNVSTEVDLIRYTVSGRGLALRSVVLRRSSLERLLSDPAGAVKVEYLQRDLLRSARRRAEYRYPRAIRAAARGRKPLVSIRVALASVL